MLFSTAGFSTDAHPDDIYAEAKRQLFWLAAGLVICAVFVTIDYHVLKRWAITSYLLAAVLLLGCFLPGVGQEINGESRWINFAALGLNYRVQPSEFAKFALILALAAYFARFSRRKDEFQRGFLFPALIAGGILGLIVAEVDLGTTAVLAAASFGLMFVAGVNWKWLTGGAAVAIAGLATLVLLVPGRMGRVLAFLDLEGHAQGVGLQQKMATLAFGSGGVDGLGLGAGRLKMLYLPFAHTDFIFPMIGEELGLLATLSVVLCFGAFAAMGLSIAHQAPDRFGKLLATGIVLAISVQAILNMAVTTAVFPNTGLPLPFVSYGGSHLVCSLLAVGVLLNIFRQGGRSF